MRAFLRFFPTLILCLSSLAYAGEFNVTLGSVHFQNNSEQNNINPGVGYLFDTSVVDEYFGWEPKGRDAVGFYLNSHKKWSIYAGYYRAFDIPAEWRVPNLELGWMAGVALGGYDNCIRSMPAVLLIGTYSLPDGWKVRATIAPIDSGVVTFSLARSY